MRSSRSWPRKDSPSSTRPATPARSPVHWPEPDDDPYITQVGGTTLATCAPGGALLSETAWNARDGQDSTSGGYSANYSIAATATWQKGISMSANHGSTTRRNIPDVAMVADDILIVADSGQQEITGGTSAAVQLWAAFNALVNEQAAASGQPSVGLINPAIYALGKSTSYSAVFNDITAGNNSTSMGPLPSSSRFPVTTFAPAGVPRLAAASSWPLPPPIAS